MAERPRALRLDPADNVAVAVVPLEPGEEVLDVRLRDAIRFGHKLALRDIPAGEPVLKYHEVIGRASTDISAGEHVHVHNVVSARLPGPKDAA
jgi:altronate dehydratase